MWSAERIVAALEAWAAEHGRPPTVNEWRRADPRGRRPTYAWVQEVFGSWTRAIAEAGLEPRARGAQPAGELCRRGLHLLSIEGRVSPGGRRYCQGCSREWRRRWQARRRADRERKARHARRRRELGLCVRCGKQPAAAGRVCCTGCLAHLRAADARRRAKRAT